MTTESIFTIIAILLAGYTLIPIEDKKLIGLKFTKSETFILIIVSIYILYLTLFFDHFVKWFDSWEIFTNANGLTANEYSFILSLILIIYIGYKVLKSKFPKPNRGKLLDYYDFLANREKHNLLYELINKYELDALLKVHFKKDNTLTTKEIENFKLFSTILDEKVVESFTKIDPYFYSKFINNILGDHRYIDSFQLYYKFLISNPYSPLNRELRDNKIDNLLLENKPILTGIIGDPEIAGGLRIYQPIGNYCKELLRKEREKKTDSDYNRAYYNDSILWTLPVTYCISFFNLMIHEAIQKKHKDFLWLNYYERFVQMICENINTDNLTEEEKESEFPTYNHRLIYDIIDNTESWLTFVSENYFNGCIAPSILTSLFSSLTYLADSSNNQISEEFRAKRFELGIRVYFHIREEIQSEYLIAIFSRFGKKSQNFKDLFAIAWDNVVDDKWAGMPYSHEIIEVQKYVTEVIEKLDIKTQFRGDWLTTK